MRGDSRHAAPKASIKTVGPLSFSTRAAKPKVTSPPAPARGRGQPQNFMEEPPPREERGARRRRGEPRHGHAGFDEASVVRVVGRSVVHEEHFDRVTGLAKEYGVVDQDFVRAADGAEQLAFAEDYLHRSSLVCGSLKCLGTSFRRAPLVLEPAHEGAYFRAAERRARRRQGEQAQRRRSVARRLAEPPARERATRLADEVFRHVGRKVSPGFPALGPRRARGAGQLRPAPKPLPTAARHQRRRLRRALPRSGRRAPPDAYRLFQRLYRI